MTKCFDNVWSKTSGWQHYNLTVAQFSVFKKIQPDIKSLDILLCHWFSDSVIQQIESLVLLAVLAMYRALFFADP